MMSWWSSAKLCGSGSSFVKPAELCSCGPVAARSQHDAAATSGVLVPGTVTVYPAHRTNRVSILDAINQPRASVAVGTALHLAASGPPPAQILASGTLRTGLLPRVMAAKRTSG